MKTISDIKSEWLQNQIAILETTGLNKAQIANKLCIVPQQLNNILSGSRGISDKFIDKFVTTFNINQIDLFNDALPSVKEIPLIPLEAFAGYSPEQYQDIPIENTYHITEFDQADFLIRVKGDSMIPRFNGGDIVACKKILDLLYFQWHRIYVVYTKSQGIMIKRIEQSTNKDFITLVSDNPEYKPFEIPKNDISDIALVLGAITLE